MPLNKEQIHVVFTVLVSVLQEDRQSSLSQNTRQVITSRSPVPEGAID